ncbi:DNA-binding membrane protein [Escherichia coli]|uniref:DNA-binding membrane protein n=1 Tax=Escherichia coli TaxID=562 RepID=A0A376P3K0_ECOLX|nr:DNA-binding membrane protein [Escherichia coli]
MQQDELARQFAQTQQQRYGEQYQHDVPVNAEDADAAAEAELARQFAQLNNNVIPANNRLGRIRSRWMILNFRQ